jgi:AraC family transcriptional regulator, transcriptional activator of pobA
MEIMYRTLQDFFKSIGLPLSQDFEMTVHRLEGLHGDAPRKSPQFRTDYYAFLLITGGKSRYTIDAQAFDLGQNAFYFTNPGHLKSFDIEIPLSGFMLTFTEAFVKQHFQGDFLQLFPFLIHESKPVMYLDAVLAEEISSLFEMMLQEYKGNAAYKKAVLTNQLMILLYKTKELLVSHQAPTPSSNRASDIVNRFKILLNDSFRDLATGKTEKIPSIKELAASMTVHPNYLSTVIKDESGKSASDWIHDRTLSEAQALLSNDTKTISEIAFALGFTDSTHFAKFFKKKTAFSPLAYRKSHKN